MNKIDELLPYIKLHFNMEHPSFEECYAYGYECGLKEIDESENPFVPGSNENEQWAEGWLAGFYKEEPIYDLTDYFMTPEEEYDFAANDEHYFSDKAQGFLVRVLEISSIIAVSAVLGYQVIDMVA